MRTVIGTKPEQKLFIGDIVRMTKDFWPYLMKGDLGFITLARCDEVCVEGGLVDRSHEYGGPLYTMEWCYVGVFGSDSARKVRLDRLSPLEVISVTNM